MIMNNSPEYISQCPPGCQPDALFSFFCKGMVLIQGPGYSRNLQTDFNISVDRNSSIYGFFTTSESIPRIALVIGQLHLTLNGTCPNGEFISVKEVIVTRVSTDKDISVEFRALAMEISARESAMISNPTYFEYNIINCNFAILELADENRWDDGRFRWIRNLSVSLSDCTIELSSGEHAESDDTGIPCENKTGQPAKLTLEFRECCSLEKADDLCERICAVLSLAFGRIVNWFRCCSKDPNGEESYVRFKVVDAFSQGIGNEAIGPQNLKEFLNCSLNLLIGFTEDQQQALMNAIYLAIHAQLPIPVQVQFGLRFMALEALQAQFADPEKKPKSVLDGILDPSVQEDAKTQIRNSIESILKIQNYKNKLIESKITSFFSPSFQDMLQSFALQQGTCSYADKIKQICKLRNKLFHGFKKDKYSFQQICRVSSYLEVLFNFCLFKILGCNSDWVQWHHTVD